MTEIKDESLSSDESEQEICFSSDDERTLFAEARLGQEAIDFLRSNLGKWLIGVAQQEKQEALEELLHVPFCNKERILELQLKGGIADSFISWIGEAIQNGRLAEHDLETINSEENFNG